MAELYYNGTILTMDDDCPQAEAVLVEDGKIVKRGTKEAVFECRKQDTVMIDLDGKTMMPGFIDGHSHFAGFANSLSQCDLSDAEDFSDIIQKMRDFICKNKIPEGQWVSGTNYDHNFLKEKRHPDKYVLDRISTDHPIVIIHASSHMGAANTKALEIQGLNGNVSNPAGGRYGRVGETMELNGYMEENAFVRFRENMPMPKIDDLMQLFRKAQDIYAGYGITTVQEGMVTDALLQILQYAQMNQVLYLDVVGYMDLENNKNFAGNNPQYIKQYRNHLKIGGYKIFLDGSPQGKTAWMKEPYKSSSDGYSGYPVKTDEQVYKLIQAALEDGQQLLAHCNGDAAAEQYITQFEQVLQDYPEYEACRPVMVHAQFVRKEQLERMKEIDMMPSFFVAHTYYWGDIHIENLGYERAKVMSPAGTALRLNLPFTFHQDCPVLEPDVFQTVWCAVTRETKAGVKLAEEERISVYEALKANTVYAAYQYGEEQEKGTITEGKIADLIILDKNPLTVPTEELRKVKVLETIKNGNQEYNIAACII